MPIYYFASKNSKNKRILKVECSISELEKVEKDNEKDWTLIPSAPAIVSGVISHKNKPDQWFTDKLKEIKKTLPKRYGDRLNTWR